MLCKLKSALVKAEKATSPPIRQRYAMFTARKGLWLHVQVPSLFVTVNHADHLNTGKCRYFPKCLSIVVCLFLTPRLSYQFLIIHLICFKIPGSYSVRCLPVLFPPLFEMWEWRAQQKCSGRRKRRRQQMRCKIKRFPHCSCEWAPGQWSSHP